MMKTGLIATTCLLLMSGLSHAADLSGTWRTIDDKSGYERAHIEITQQADNTYAGTVIDRFTIPGATPVTTCKRCPPPYTDKPIKGLQMLTGLVADPKKPGSYINGKILDPVTGKIYSCKIQLSENGKKLRLRGYVGVSALGRSQTWLRKE